MKGKPRTSLTVTKTNMHEGACAALPAFKIKRMAACSGKRNNTPLCVNIANGNKLQYQVIVECLKPYNANTVNK